MSPRQTNLVKGTLDLLILKTLALGPRHGLGIARRIEQLTRGTFHVKAGSLFPALHRLDQEGAITETEAPAGGHGRARYYRMTKSGERQLQAATENWERVTAAVGHVLSATS